MRARIMGNGGEKNWVKLCSGESGMPPIMAAGSSPSQRRREQGYLRYSEDGAKACGRGARPAWSPSCCCTDENEMGRHRCTCLSWGQRRLSLQSQTGSGKLERAARGAEGMRSWCGRAAIRQSCGILPFEIPGGPASCGTRRQSTWVGKICG